MYFNSHTAFKPRPSNAGTTLVGNIRRIPVTLRDIEALKDHMPIVLDIEPDSFPVMLINEVTLCAWPAGYQLELWQNRPLSSTVNPDAITELKWDRTTLRSAERTLALTELLRRSGILKRTTVRFLGHHITFMAVDAGKLQDQCGWLDRQENGLSAVLLADRLLRSQPQFVPSGQVPMDKPPNVR